MYYKQALAITQPDIKPPDVSRSRRFHTSASKDETDLKVGSLYAVELSRYEYSDVTTDLAPELTSELATTTFFVAEFSKLDVRVPGRTATSPDAASRTTPHLHARFVLFALKDDGTYVRIAKQITLDIAIEGHRVIIEVELGQQTATLSMASQSN